MDHSLRALCDALKKIFSQQKPQTNRLSFVVVTGKTSQGKSALLKQSTLEEMPVLSEDDAKIYYNTQGVVVELGETWFTNSKTILQDTLKQLNRCNRHIKITGLILCIDVNELLIADPTQFAEQRKSHVQLLNRLGTNLGYPTELAIVLTKMDTLAGFSEFYQGDHTTELSKPLGFSLDCINQMPKKIETFALQFNQLIESLGQQVISKMHPARSTIKRSLIREFPLQLTSLRAPLRSLIQVISPKWFHLHSIYFTSAEQGGMSIDRLNKKIQHEYALVVQDTFLQAVNYKAYFVQGALKSILERSSSEPNLNPWPEKPWLVLTSCLAGLSLLLLSYSHFKASHLLDETSKELLAYDTLKNQGGNKAEALFHLSNAVNQMDHINSNRLSLPTLYQLKKNLHYTAQNQLHGEFFPSLVNEIEQTVMSSSQTPIARYKALKIYLMLAQPEYLNINEARAWFKNQWKNQNPIDSEKKLALLESILSKPLKNIPIKQQVIRDARNYLNALPTSYLYYSIAKESFPTTKNKLLVQGFNLATQEVPVYFTKSGFNEIIQKLPQISEKLQSENWILARQDVPQLHNMLVQAYCFDYVTWWQTFMKKSQPLHFEDYLQGRQVTQLVQQSNAINLLIHLVQEETKPDIIEQNSMFNQSIARQFTDLNLMSPSSTLQLSAKIAELEGFISTLSVINDGGKTAFSITKTRFMNEYVSDPISMLYTQAKQVPEPLSSWTKQLAGDAWALLIKDSRQYINQQWQKSVYLEFQKTIAQRYPFDSSKKDEISIADFNRFFSPHGVLNSFTEEYLRPFLDVSHAEWKPKAVNDFVLPITTGTLDEIIRANIITNMFFPTHGDESNIEFSLRKINLDPIVASLNLQIGETTLTDTQSTESFMRFTWPQNNAKLSLNSIEGNHYELAEEGTWALFKLLEKVNVLVDEQDSSSLQILFEVNSNTGRYLLKTNNQINPFTPGILNGFTLNEVIA